MRPEKIIILGKEYKVTYVDKPSDVDIWGRQSLWGQVDYWTRTIRVYAGNRTDEDILETLIHEILHVIGSELHVDVLDYKSDSEAKKVEELIDIISLALTDTFVRNGWINVRGDKQ